MANGNTAGLREAGAERARLDVLRRRLEEDAESLRPRDGDSLCGSDFESLVSAAQTANQHETDELLRRRLERRLADIERVTRRIPEGSYGLCSSCGQPIPEERLAAMPDATLCVPCSPRSHSLRRTSPSQFD